MRTSQGRFGGRRRVAKATWWEDSVRHENVTQCPQRRAVTLCHTLAASHAGGAGSDKMYSYPVKQSAIADKEREVDASCLLYSSGSCRIGRAREQGELSAESLIQPK